MRPTPVRTRVPANEDSGVSDGVSGDRTVLVTGGAGYIGSHCCKGLAEAGYKVVVFDDFSTGHREFVRWGPVETGDIRDRAALDRVFKTWRPHGVLHFAALALVGESGAAPGRYYDVNVAGTLALLEAMAASGCENLVFSSSCSVYGECDVLPIPEDLPFRPLSPYAATKAVCEQMADDFGRAHGLRSARLRYFNAAGADPAADIGEWHEPETHLIPLVLDAALGRRPEIVIFGDDYSTPDGTCIRDYVHVTDLADVHVRALEHIAGGGTTFAANLGTGRGYSVREVIGAVERVTGRPVNVRVAERRPGDAPALVADPAGVAGILGWQAARADIETIVGDAWRWHQKAFGANAGCGTGGNKAEACRPA